jgi:predicted PurR-regulated permease PerM
MNSEMGRMPPVRFPQELAVAVLLVVLSWGLWAGQAFFVPLLLAALLAFLASPLVRWLGKAKIPEWLAIIFAALFLALPVGFVGYMLLRQAQALVADYPAIVEALQTWIKHLGETSIGMQLHLTEHLTMAALAEQLGNGAGEGMKAMALGLRTALDTGTETVVIFLFAILMLASRKHLYLSGEKILSSFESIEAASVLGAVTNLIEKFLLTKLVVIAIVTVLALLILQLLGLKYAFLVALITGLMTLIPGLGFGVSLALTLVVAMATGHGALSVVVIIGSMGAVHLLEANVLTPKLVGKKLNLNALATFVGLFGGGLLWGVWGILLSVPLLGILRIVFSAAPRLQPWAFLLSAHEDRQLGLELMSRSFRAERLAVLLARTKENLVRRDKRSHRGGPEK